MTSYIADSQLRISYFFLAPIFFLLSPERQIYSCRQKWLQRL